MIAVRTHDSVTTSLRAGRSHRSNRRLGIAMLAVFLSTALAGGPFLSEMLLSRVKKEYGRVAEQSLIRWQKLIVKNADISEKRKLERVNLYFNVIPYAPDPDTWGVRDYWSTPVEFLIRDRGDCEDYAIAKYFTLRMLGVDSEKLRVLWVRVVERGKRSRVGKGLNANLSHMVLGYYETPASSPLILDNMSRVIKPASERTDLKPMSSFNADDLLLSMIRKRGVDVKYRDGYKQWHDFMLTF